MFSGSESANKIMLKIEEQAKSVRRTFERLPSRNSVSSATAAIAQEIAETNKKRKSESVSSDDGPRARTRARASFRSTSCFHSPISLVTRVNNTCAIDSVADTLLSKTRTIFPEYHYQSRTLTLSNNDVVCGNGKITNELIGNKRFRVWIGLHSASFARASSEEDRMNIARCIVDTIKGSVPKGRYLSLYAQTGEWYDVGYEKSVRITLRALEHEKMMHESAPAVRSSPGSSKRNTYASTAA